MTCIVVPMLVAMPAAYLAHLELQGIVALNMVTFVYADDPASCASTGTHCAAGQHQRKQFAAPAPFQGTPPTSPEPSFGICGFQLTNISQEYFTNIPLRDTVYTYFPRNTPTR